MTNSSALRSRSKSLSLSVNQLVAETRKACLGKGVSFGMADDIAKAVQILAQHHIVPEQELVSYLNAPLESAPQMPLYEGHALHLTGIVGLADIVAALDFVAAYQAKTLMISSMSYPRLSLGLLIVFQAPHIGSFQDQKGQLISSLFATSADSLLLNVTDYRAMAPQNWPARITLSSAAYETLKTHAFETYVPSSDQSRSAGAGAGLNDND